MTIDISNRISPYDLQQQPIEVAETIPSEWYYDPAFHQWELKAIHHCSWQCIGHINRVKNPGDYFSATVGNNPLLVVRDKENVLRAFYNVCRHRGGPLVTEAEGCVNALQCQYHGWTYWLDGMLRGVPEFDHVKLFDKKDYGLVPLSMEVWQGLIFVNLAKSPMPFAPSVDGISERIAPMELSDLLFHSRVTYDIDCNWKAYVDNYLEGYHIPYVHPELNKLLDYREYVTETSACYSLQHSPFKDDTENFYGGDGEAFYYFIFPNTMLNILPGRLQINQILPLREDRCRVIFDYYYADIKSVDQKAFIAEDIRYSDEIQQEDIDICVRVQQGLASMAYDRGRFSVKREEGVYHFQSLIKEFYKQALARK